MDLTRRSLFHGIAGISTLSLSPEVGTGSEPSLLPDKRSFPFRGCHLNAAYTHPMAQHTRGALEAYLAARTTAAGRNWPAQNARDEAVELYAALINARPSEIAVVPSTLEGENLLAASLGLGHESGVVTDAFHYDASLVLYGELQKAGMPLTCLAPRNLKIDYSELEKAIGPQTKLVSVSLVSSVSGMLHDLKRICDIAHAKGVLVYADIIQAVGAVPVDVKASGVDFCCAGTYKWLMADFGTAFLYVRPDRLPMLRRVQVGWRQVKDYAPEPHLFGQPNPLKGNYVLGTDTASIFEVSSPNWAGLAAAAASLRYLLKIGVDNIVRHREPLLKHLASGMQRLGFSSITPLDSMGPYMTFHIPGAFQKYAQLLQKERVFVTVNGDRIRVAISVYNDAQDIDKLLAVLGAARQS